MLNEPDTVHSHSFGEIACHCFFYREWFSEQIECTIGYHRRVGKIGSDVLTITGRLQTYKLIVPEKDNTDIRSCLREAKGHFSRQAAEMPMGCKYKNWGVLQKSLNSSAFLDPSIKLRLHEVPHDDASALLVRERVSGTRFESVFWKQRRRNLIEKNHTFSCLLTGRTYHCFFSKCDIALALSDTASSFILLLLLHRGCNAEYRI